MQAVLATSNEGKVREIAHYLDAEFWDLKPQSYFAISSPPETGHTFIENALIKARHASEACGLAAIADDSGLVVPALQGQPGVHSARYAGDEATDKENNAKLVAEFKKRPNLDRRAYYVCVLVYLSSPTDPTPLIVEKRWWGEILDKPQGDQGFGYDPYFWLPELSKTAAELTLDEKNAISHRGQALDAFSTALLAQTCVA